MSLVPSRAVLAAACSAALAILYYIYTHYLRAARKFPPGPPSVPIIGSLCNIQVNEAWGKFTEYKELYGDLVFLHRLGNRLLVLNSMEAINDLLEKKGSIYSDRPIFTMVGELMNLGQSMPLLPAQDEWRIQRKLVHSALSITAVKQYHSVQEDLAALLSKQLLDNPDGFFHHVRLTASRFVLSITYGLSVNTADNHYITRAEETMHVISQATVPGAFLCDLFPWMKYLHSSFPFQKKAREGRRMIEWLVSAPFEHVKREMAAGTARQSLTHNLLSASAEDVHDHIKWATGSLYGAGGETTYATVLTCIMAMALHPEKQKLAQEEIDRILGEDRLPTMNDRTNLPYINAVIKETMRWHPVLPLSIARCNAQADTYKGYSIPKGTTVIPNIWAIAFERRGPYHPNEFVPERFLVENDEDVPTDPASWAFGFARRVCPGRYVAENSLFILIATILAVFDIAPPLDGKMDVRFTTGLVSYPVPFQCRITPRTSSKASQIVWRAAQSAL